MNVKEAVKIAKEHVLDLFAEEEISNLGLEEVEYDDNTEEWFVTLGFSRPWDEPRNTLASLAQASTPNRSYKIVRIHSGSEQVKDIKNYAVSS